MGRAVSPGFRLTVIAVAFAVASLCLVAFGVFALWLRSYDLAEIAAWQRAEPCSAAVGDCSVNVGVVGGLPDRQIELGWLGIEVDAGKPRIDGRLQTGDSVSVELWRGRVVEVGRVPTQDNPNQIDPSSTDIRFAIGLILVGLTVGPFIAYLWLRERRRLQRLG